MQIVTFEVMKTSSLVMVPAAILFFTAAPNAFSVLYACAVSKLLYPRSMADSIQFCTVDSDSSEC